LSTRSQRRPGFATLQDVRAPGQRERNKTHVHQGWSREPWASRARQAAGRRTACARWAPWHALHSSSSAFQGSGLTGGETGFSSTFLLPGAEVGVAGEPGGSRRSDFGEAATALCDFPWTTWPPSPSSPHQAGHQKPLPCIRGMRWRHHASPGARHLRSATSRHT